MRFRLRTLLIVMGVIPPVVYCVWLASRSEEGGEGLGTLVLFGIAVWLGSRFVIYLNTRV